MVRILNFCCFAISALACLGLYHVSEQTRVTTAQLRHVNHEIAREQSAMSVLQAEWARVADPARIQRLAQAELGLTDTPTVELSSLTMLPRRGASVPVGNADVRNASVIVPVKREDPRIHLASVRSGN